MTIERTRQQIDPASSTNMAPVTIVLVIGAFVYAVFTTVRGSAQISNPTLAVIALVFFAIAVAAQIFASRPSRAPFTRGSHGVVVAAALLAVVCEGIAQRGSDTFIRDDWGSIALGVLLATFGPYRPAKEILASTAICAVIVGVITYGEFPSLVTPAPALAFVVVAVIPLVALGLSTVTFSSGVVASIEHWQKLNQEQAENLEGEFRESITRSVQQDRVTILDQQVLPLFNAVLERNQVMDADRDHARMIAKSLRQVMVDELDRSWLESFLEFIGISLTNRPGAAKAVLSDPQHVASAMTAAQRVALRAVVLALVSIPQSDRSYARIVLSDLGDVHEGVFVMRMLVTDQIMRSSIAPLLAVMRASFVAFSVDLERADLTLRFSYDHD